MYDVALWKYYPVTAFSKFKAAITSALKVVWLCKKRQYVRYSILLDLGLPTADTIVHNCRFLFASRCLLSRNQIVQWFADVAV